MMSRIGYLSTALFLVAAAGCGGGNTGTASGTVHMDGKPLVGAKVTFYPQVAGGDAFSNAGTPQGLTDESGHYELFYGRGESSTSIGKYTVYIETLVEAGGDYGKSRAEEVPKRYNSESELIVSIESGGNTIDFMDLTSDGDKNEGRDSGGRY